MLHEDESLDGMGSPFHYQIEELQAELLDCNTFLGFSLRETPRPDGDGDVVATPPVYESPFPDNQLGLKQTPEASTQNLVFGVSLGF